MDRLRVDDPFIKMTASEHKVTDLPASVLIAGSSGLIGSALVEALRAQGCRIRRLVREEPTSEDEVYWNPEDGTIDLSEIEAADALISFSGENIAGGRWSARRRQAILNSRLAATRTLAQALTRASRRPAIWINASAVGYYGDRGREVLNEESGPGAGFLVNVCEQWEAATHAADLRNVRIAFARFGVVLSPRGGALAKLLPVFRARLGGCLGHGDQWMSWISILDAIGALLHLLANDRCEGAVNVVAPNPVTNREFTASLARALGRPARFPVPGLVLRAVFGQMAAETLLASQRAVPARLLATGFQFQYPTLESALRELLGRGQI